MPAPTLPRHRWTETLRLPERFVGYGREPIEQLPAGEHGKTAFLQLHFERRGGRTRLVRNFGGAHQVVRRVLPIDRELDDLAAVMIMQNSAGILQGDRVRTEITVGEGARALVTTQSATKVFSMERNYATQRIDVSVAAGGYCEVLLDPLIAYEGSRLYNEVNLTVDPDGTLVLADQITPGRVAHGESWRFELLHSRVRVERPDGRLIVADTQVLEPGRYPVSSPGLFDDHRDMGVVYVISESGDDQAALADVLHASVADIPGVVGGASALPSGVGAHVRVLGDRTSVTTAALHEAWRAARRHLLDAAIPPLHRLKYGFEPALGRPDNPATKAANA
ncbi:MAG: urease accessory protein UreD [Acidimicrobiales bacterium]